jgi:hypothetical protein
VDISNLWFVFRQPVLRPPASISRETARARTTSKIEVRSVEGCA